MLGRAPRPSRATWPNVTQLAAADCDYDRWGMLARPPVSCAGINVRAVCNEPDLLGRRTGEAAGGAGWGADGVGRVRGIGTMCYAHVAATECG